MFFHPLHLHLSPLLPSLSLLFSLFLSLPLLSSPLPAPASPLPAPAAPLPAPAAPLPTPAAPLPAAPLPAAGAAEPGTPPFPGDLRPAAPVHSRDGGITVHAPRFRAAYRGPVLLFCDRLRKDLSRAAGLSFSPENGLLEIVIGSRPGPDARVLPSRFRDRSTGAVKERIELPDPERSDLPLLRRALCRAFLRIWIAGAAPDPARPPAELPGWLADGLARHISGSGRQEDIDRTLLLWSNASLPPAMGLFSEKSPAAEAEPAVAAVLAAWTLDRRRGRSLLEESLRAAAAGRPWAPLRAARFLAADDPSAAADPSDSADPSAFDRLVDRKMLAARRIVASPGVTTPGVLRRFRSSLLLFAPGSDNLADSFFRGTGFREAIARSGEPAIRSAALRRAGPMRLAAIGRDGAFREIARAYEAFLLALASGREKPGGLLRMLSAADSLRLAAEARAARGETLRDPPRP